MEPQRYLRCLGHPILFAPTGEPIRFRTRKHLALLVYIAVEARSHRRDRLAELLWPKVSGVEARHSLATALSTLRPRLGLDALETSRDHVRLLPGRVALDLDRLQAGDVLGTEVTGPLEVAAFLDGFDIADSAEFTHWKDRQQARLLPVIKDALLVLIDRCRRTGDTRQIEQVADRMLALDELSEEAIRAKMEARAFAGDRLTALEIFEAWKKNLAEELQAVPSELVEGMAVRLRRRGWERTTLANIPNVPTDQWRGRPFIGRTAEYKVLYERWEAARKGLPGHVLLLGDSGVGKTTLVQRLTTSAGLQGAAISRIQCYDIEREIPYSTLSSLISGLLDCPGFSATSPESLSELSRMVPEVRRRFPNIPVSSDSHGETARIRLTEACLEMLGSIAEEHPVILVIDDLHLADDVSLAVLHLIMRRAHSFPIMVVSIARPRELIQSSQAAMLRAGAGALGLREIELSPLSHAESAEMLTSLLQHDEEKIGISARLALLRSAAGFPMVLELLVQDWKACGDQSLALSIEAMTVHLNGEQHAQSFYKHILTRLTHSLDNTTHSVLNLASILGHRLNDLSLYALVDLTTGQTVSGMAELVNRRVLRDSAQGLEFVNELVRAAGYVAVPSSLRRMLHSRIADHLIKQRAQGVNEIDLEIAWHCMRAAREGEATSYLLNGARDSLLRGAVYSAERALTTALPHLPPSVCTEARLLLAEVLQEQGRWVESLAVLAEVQRDHAPELVPILATIAELTLNVPNADEARRYVPALRAAMLYGSDNHVRVKAANAAALTLTYSRSVDDAKELLECVKAIPTSLLDTGDLTTLADSKARMLYNAFERGSCLKELVQVATRLHETKEVNSTIVSLHNGLGALACCQGDYVKARNEVRYAYDMCIRLGNDAASGWRAAQLALCCFRLGEYADAVAWGTRTLDTLGEQFAGYVECQAAQYIGCSCALSGNHKRAIEAIQHLDARIPADIAPWVIQAWLFAKADILYLLGDVSEAIVWGRKGVGSDCLTLYSTFFAGAFARWLALSTMGTSREGMAREKLNRMVRDLDSYDAIDQAEVLCARRILHQGGREDLRESSQLIQIKLRALPQAITKQLERLGMLVD